MNKDQITTIFTISCLTLIFISPKLFAANVIVFFLVLIYYLHKNDDNEFDED